MWRSEKTESGRDLVWSQPEFGVASSALQGTANIQNANIATQPGQIMASFARAKNDSVENITGGTLTPDGATLFDAPSALHGGAWIKVTASTVSSIAATTNPTTVTVDYLAAGGGGGGGGANSLGTNLDASGGGGGAGEVETSTFAASTGSYPVVIGNGGDGGTTTGSSGTNGENTTIGGSITANGGGGGGGSTSTDDDGKSGGSGGGGGGEDSLATSGTGGTATAGNNGGNGSITGDGGGGGGAGGSGGNGSSTIGGNGGNGVSSTITGTSVFYGGGGGGGAAGGVSPNPGDGGNGGGGEGGSTTGSGVPTQASAGEANTGGGGGGGGGTDSVDMVGAAGGTGIAIISYPTGSMFAIGGTVSYSGSDTIHTFTEDGEFTVLQIAQDGYYYVSYEDASDKIKLSSVYDPYGTSAITHGTTGSITFDVVGAIAAPVAKATERYYDSSGATQFRYYVLDNASYVWCYDTKVYADTLSANGVGITWTMIDYVDYETTSPIKGMNVLNGWLIFITNNYILGKKTVTLGATAELLKEGFISNGLNDVARYAHTGSQGTLLYTDGNFIGEIFPTTSLITSEANLQSYCAYTASTTTGTISNVIGGSLPFLTSGTRVPVVFFPAEGGTLPTAITPAIVYFIAYNNAIDTFKVFDAITGGVAIDIETGATGTQYFNTFYPIGEDSGSNGTNPTLQLTPQRLNLPFYETAQKILELDNGVLIGCKSNIVYPWNQVDAVPSNVVPLPEGDVQTMINVNNTAYVFAGDKGNIYLVNSTAASLVLTIPDYTAGVPGTANSYIEPTFVWGDAIFCRGRVYCSILDQTATKAGNCGGAWSFIPSENVDPQQNVGSALRLENQNSYGDYDGYSPIMIVDQEQNGQSPKFWAYWQDSYNTSAANFGIDYSTANPVTQYVVETDLIAPGTNLTQRTFEQVEYKLSVPPIGSDAVALYYRSNPTGEWVALTGLDTQTTGDVHSGLYPVNFEKVEWLQFRALVTTSGSAATSTFVPLTEIRLR